ncbi:pre T-cell antigen receptor alpha [Tiliqua scincoides]|uniref:pre T-cell antigen receptor alpha n=1 Tax=Tiliqua scincoides TaxID=71010 RepID=UPI0034621144
MPQALNTNLPWRLLRYLLTSTALHLLTSGSYSLSLVPTLAPPLSVVINGERKTLVVCMANDPSEDALGTFWFSNGNGTMLKSFTYGISMEEDGTFSTLSLLSITTQEFESWDMVACYVAKNETSRIWSTTSLPIMEENMRDPCLDETQGAQDQMLSPEVLHNRLQVLLLLAIRMLLFKCILFDVLMTCCLLYKR